ncbi:hypothetical protein AB1Y20_011184 [Prymnesium parvum]|uniref:Uncharacterized protein n=1 Tax=Prymnesium parvum TaxID=97485 RepID=A0AB34IL37_PRYPA
MAPVSGKQKKALLQAQRRLKAARARSNEAAAAAAAPLRWWELGLAPSDTRVLRVRLSLVRARRSSRVRAAFHILAPPAPPPPAPPPPTPAERRAAQLRRQLQQAEDSLRRSGRSTPAEGLALWRRGVEGAAGTIEGVCGAAGGGEGETRRRLFPLGQLALQSGPLKGAQPARFRRLVRDAYDGSHPDVQLIEKLLQALGGAAEGMTEQQRLTLSKWREDFAERFDGSLPKEAASCEDEPMAQE